MTPRTIIHTLGLLLLTAVGSALAGPNIGVRTPSDAAFTLRNGNQCLDIHESQWRTSGALVQTWQCDGRDTQAWRLDRGHLVNMANGRCLEVNRLEAGQNGARVQVVDCQAGPQQVWRLERGQLMTLVDDRCLDLHSADQNRNAARVQTWACHGGKNQHWLQGGLEVAERRTRDIEAGPIWNQIDAQAKCPSVCMPGTWSGQWRTTVQGRMSVCGCTSEATAPTARFEPVPWHQGAQPMDPNQFDELIKAIKAEGFPSGQMGVVESAARDNHFLMVQLKEVIESLSFSADRMRVTEIMAPRVLDRKNLHTLYSAFDFESEKDKVRSIFQRLP